MLMLIITNATQIDSIVDQFPQNEKMDFITSFLFIYQQSEYPDCF